MDVYAPDSIEKVRNIILGILPNNESSCLITSD